MVDRILKDSDLKDAENFLTQYLSERVTEASFDRGSAVRDFLVNGFTYLYAFLRGEADSIVAVQSLARMQAIKESGEDIDFSVDSVLSNWFLKRKEGSIATLTAKVHFSTRKAVTIPSTAKFYKTSSLVFYINTAETAYVIPEQQLYPIFNSVGTVVDYAAEIPLVAAKPGADYNVTPGRFLKIEVPGGLPNFLYAENVLDAVYGKGAETSVDFLSRAETAVTVKNLVNNRSCDSVLRDSFVDVEDTLTIGMGEKEMTRDLLVNIPHIRLHTGGKYDTYIGTPTKQTAETGLVGGYFTRPDNLITIFQDPGLTTQASHSFVDLGVKVGGVLNIHNGIVGAPVGYVISSVQPHTLSVSDRTPFTEASDELSTNAVVYSIEGITFFPGISVRTAVGTIDNPHFGTSRRLSIPGSIILSGQPIQDITRVELLDPDVNDIALDPVTATVVFNTRVNGLPTDAVSPSTTQYQLEVLNPGLAQSRQAINVLRVGTRTDPSKYADKTLKVSYLTANSFMEVSNYIKAQSVRVVAANQVIRAKHPIWISVDFTYKMKDTTTDIIDEASAAQYLAEHINTFDTQDTLDVSDLTTYFRSVFPSIGVVYPPVASFVLCSPDGQLVKYTTTDVISIYPKSADNGVIISNKADIKPTPNMMQNGILALTTDAQVATYFFELGISDRTVRYLTRESLLTFTLKKG